MWTFRVEGAHVVTRRGWHRAFLLGAASVFLLTVSALSAGAASPAIGGERGRPTIDTYEDWAGGGLGCMGLLTPTCGQVITIPAGKHRLRAFAMYLDLDGDRRATFRGEVYSWDTDERKAKRPIWESAPIERRPSSEYEEVRFAPRAKVRPGQQYILFLTFSRDYEDLSEGAAGYLAALDEDVLPDGTTAEIEDRGDESLWTTQSWGTFVPPNGWEVAMKVWLR